MPSRRKVPEEVRLAIVDAVRHGGRTFDEIPKEYSVSQATVSRIAQAANLSSSHGKRVRSQAGVQADRTYDKEARVGFLDDLLATLQNMTQKSNLSPKDLKEISQAGSAVLSSRHAEDPPESEDEVVQKGDAQIELVEAFGDLKNTPGLADEVDDKLEKKREAMERGEAWAFPSYGVNPEHDPPWMVEAYRKMLAKMRAGEASSANSCGRGPVVFTVHLKRRTVRWLWPTGFNRSLGPRKAWPAPTTFRPVPSPATLQPCGARASLRR